MFNRAWAFNYTLAYRIIVLGYHGTCYLVRAYSHFFSCHLTTVLLGIVKRLNYLNLDLGRKDGLLKLHRNNLGSCLERKDTALPVQLLICNERNTAWIIRGPNCLYFFIEMASLLIGAIAFF